MGSRTARPTVARRRRFSAAVVGLFLTFAFAVGQAGTGFALGGIGGSNSGATRPTGTSKPAPSKQSTGTVAKPLASGTAVRHSSHSSKPTKRSTTSPLASAGGDFSMDFIAAGPGTYDHDTGVGGAYNNRTIDKNSGVVESLEGGDFACGDLVVFFGQFVADSSLASGNYAANLTFNYGETTTGQPGIGFDDVVSVGINSPDTGNKNLDGNESAVNQSESDVQMSGKPFRQVVVHVEGMNPGDTIIIRMVVHLGCEVGAHPTGNILDTFVSGSIVGDGPISSGSQTVPMKKVEDVAQPGIDVAKTCPQSGAVGSQITYSITVTNTGNEALTNLVVKDPLLGGDLSGFGSSLAAGASVTKTFNYTIKANDPDPLQNSVTATANGQTSGATVQDTDACSTDVIHQPGIKVAKTCPANAQIGDTITYSITVTNTGNEDLNNLAVTDALLGGTLGAFPSTLAAGASVTKTFTYAIKASDPDPLTNSVTASAKGADSGQTVQDSDSCETDILNPGISVTKSCPKSAGIGDTITYSITVSNTGDEDLNNLVVDDPLLGGHLSGFGSTLAVGASVTKTFTHTVTAGDPDPLTNTVTASAKGVSSGKTVEDTDSCETDILHNPGIDVSKTCPTSANLGDTITYSITVTNTGNEALTDLVVNDPLLGGNLSGFGSTLAVGASVTKTFTHTITASDPDPLTNTVTATAKGADSGGSVEDSASCTTDVLHQPGISVSKTCPQAGGVGDTITYSITVTNTGNEALTDLVVNDPLLGGNLSGFGSTLAVGASVTKTFTHTITASDPDPLTNTVTATAKGADSGDSVEDSASCKTDVLNPQIDLVKGGVDFAHVGDTIPYDFTVTNTGDADLHDVKLVDPICNDGTITIVTQGDGDSTLAVDETWTYSCTHVVTAEDPDPLPNTATVYGTDDLGHTVQATDDHVVDILHPSIQVVKVAKPTSGEPGDKITYTYEVTNTSTDTTLYDVSVDDDVIGHIGDIPVLDPGQTVTLTATFTLGNEPVTNVVIASGHDTLGEQVQDDDTATVDVVLPKNEKNPPKGTAFTGANTGPLAAIALALMVTGLAAVILGRRRRWLHELRR